MKKTTKKMLCVVLCLLMFSAFSIAAYAESDIVASAGKEGVMGVSGTVYYNDANGYQAARTFPSGSTVVLTQTLYKTDYYAHGSFWDQGHYRVETGKTARTNVSFAFNR